MSSPLAVGDIVTVALPDRHPRGHEQEGKRPAVVVGLPDRLGPGRFPVVLVAPITRYSEQAWVEAAPERYPRLEEGVARLRSRSVVLLDQVLSVDVRRIERRRGSLAGEQYGPVGEGLVRMCMGSGE